jgi:hypothetical protein
MIAFQPHDGQVGLVLSDLVRVPKRPTADRDGPGKLALAHAIPDLGSREGDELQEFFHGDELPQARLALELLDRIGLLLGLLCRWQDGHKGGNRHG